ncbi:MAG: caspase family protein [Bacteroidota bacterium]
MNHGVELPFAKSHAFIVGINNYENISSLSTAVNDARELAKRLKIDHGYHVHPPLLNATKADLVKWMDHDVPNAIGADDRVIFYFAGHGIALDSEEGPNGYIVPADADPSSVDSLISMADFHKMVDGLECKHGLLILDCCFAGAFKWSTGTRDVMFDLPGVIYEERFWRYVKDAAWQVITSSAYDQKAADVLSERTLGKRELEIEGNHSPFALALFEALDGKADVIPDGDEHDGVITGTELYMYLRDRVEDGALEDSKRQTPSFFNLPKHGKGEFIFFHPNHRLNLPPAPDRNPFMGLSSYNENDASLFFGRERVVTALVEMVPSNQLLVVSGASGTGKSSVIKAGLLPNLRENGWQILPIIRPGKEPLNSLRVELPDFDFRIAENKQSVLVIDQYEELITQCLDPEEGKAFEKQIVNWIEENPGLRVILSVRSDFEPQFENSLLVPWWNSGRYIVPAFTLEEYREVIVKPASQEVLFYEPDHLIDLLVEEVSQAPGALPLLSFTLSEIYEAYLKSGRSDRALIESDYEKLGGVIGALRTRADETYNSFDDQHQNSMRKLMLRMVSMGGGELAGKRVYADELEFSDPDETKRLEEVARDLVASRLILSGKDGEGKVFIEPAHDALVRAWARLWEWIKATGEEKLGLHNKLTLAVNDYHDLVKVQPKKANNLLWNNNPRLDILNAELQHKDHGLNAKEEVFVKSSVNRRYARKRNAWAIAVAVMVGLAGLAIFAFIQQGIAKQQTSLAVKNEAKADSSATVAQLQRDSAIFERSRANENATFAQLQRDTAILERDRANTERYRADQRTKEAQSAGLAYLAPSISEEHSTLAIRLAEESFKMLEQPDFQNYQALYLSYAKLTTHPFYFKKLNGQAFFFNDFENILCLKNDGGASIHNLEGNKIGTLENCSDRLVNVFFSIDQNFIVTVDENQHLKVWSKSGDFLHDYPFRLNDVFDLKILPSDTSIVVSLRSLRSTNASADQPINLYKGYLFAKDGESVQVLKQNLPKNQLRHKIEISPSGHKFLTNNKWQIEVWDKNGQLIQSHSDKGFVGYPPETVARFNSQDGLQVIASVVLPDNVGFGGISKLYVYEYNSEGNIIKSDSADTPEFNAALNFLEVRDFSFKNELLVSSFIDSNGESNLDLKVYIHNFEGEKIFDFQNFELESGMVFWQLSPDDKLVFTELLNDVQSVPTLLEFESGKTLKTLGDPDKTNVANNIFVSRNAEKAITTRLNNETYAIYSRSYPNSEFSEMTSYVWELSTSEVRKREDLLAKESSQPQRKKANLPYTLEYSDTDYQTILSDANGKTITKFDEKYIDAYYLFANNEKILIPFDLSTTHSKARLIIYNIKTREIEWEANYQNDIYDIEFSSDSSTFFVGLYESIDVYFVNPGPNYGRLIHKIKLPDYARNYRLDKSGDGESILLTKPPDFIDDGYVVEFFTAKGIMKWLESAPVSGISVGDRERFGVKDR